MREYKSLSYNEQTFYGLPGGSVGLVVDGVLFFEAEHGPQLVAAVAHFAQEPGLVLAEVGGLEL